MPHVLVQLQYFSLLEEEQFLCVKPTRVTQICKGREGYSFQQQYFCTESFTQEPHEVQPGEVQIPALGRKPPGNWYMLWATQVESSLAEKGLGSCQCVLVARTTKWTPGCIRRGIASRSKGWSFSTQHCLGLTMRAVSSSGLPCTKETWTHQRESSKGSWRWWKNWNSPPVRNGWKSCHSSAWSREVLERISSILKGKSVEHRDRLFPVVLSDRTRDNGHKLKHRKCRVNRERNSSIVRMNEHWQSLPKGAVKSLSLEVFKTYWTWPWAISSRWPYLSSGAGQGDLQRSLPTATILWSKTTPTF